MAKKKQRTDAERRLRQCERLSRLLRVLHLISGKGRWDADGLAQELECSRRTIHRLLQTLSMAGVPWYFDESARAYRVRQGFRFPLSDQADASSNKAALTRQVHESIDQLVTIAGQLSASLQHLVDACGSLKQELP